MIKILNYMFKHLITSNLLFSNMFIGFATIR